MNIIYIVVGCVILGFLNGNCIFFIGIGKASCGCCKSIDVMGREVFDLIIGNGCFLCGIVLFYEWYFVGSYNDFIKIDCIGGYCDVKVVGFISEDFYVFYMLFIVVNIVGFNIISIGIDFIEGIIIIKIGFSISNEYFVFVECY